MKIGIVAGKGCNLMCVGPLCFHGFAYREKVIIKKADCNKVAYLCLQWGEMIPN